MEEDDNLKVFNIAHQLHSNLQNNDTTNDDSIEMLIEVLVDEYDDYLDEDLSFFRDVMHQLAKLQHAEHHQSLENNGNRSKKTRSEIDERQRHVAPTSTSLFDLLDATQSDSSPVIPYDLTLEQILSKCHDLEPFIDYLNETFVESQRLDRLVDCCFENESDYLYGKNGSSKVHDFLSILQSGLSMVGKTHVQEKYLQFHWILFNCIVDCVSYSASLSTSQQMIHDLIINAIKCLNGPATTRIESKLSQRHISKAELLENFANILKMIHEMLKVLGQSESSLRVLLKDEQWESLFESFCDSYDKNMKIWSIMVVIDPYATWFSFLFNQLTVKSVLRVLAKSKILNVPSKAACEKKSEARRNLYCYQLQIFHKTILSLRCLTPFNKFHSEDNEIRGLNDLKEFLDRGDVWKDKCIFVLVKECLELIHILKLDTNSIPTI